nr:cytochrome P450 cinnamate-4-hydroxylase {N-terminal} [Phaseolus vulgaris=French beans, cv immuna, Peptide Partial, 23 aa] [Phaseolus vulgaris]
MDLLLIEKTLVALFAAIIGAILI